MIVNGVIVKFNPKCLEPSKGKNRFKYDNVLVQLDKDANEDELKEFGLVVNSFKDKKFVSLNLPSTSKVNTEMLTNEHCGSFSLAKTKSNIVFVKEATLTNMFE